MGVQVGVEVQVGMKGQAGCMWGGSAGGDEGAGRGVCGAGVQVGMKVQVGG